MRPDAWSLEDARRCELERNRQMHDWMTTHRKCCGNAILDAVRIDHDRASAESYDARLTSNAYHCAGIVAEAHRVIRRPA